MACSKICSGNLVELAEEIIQYLRDDISTLYSCALVNRLWCRIAIPLLWEDPFSVPTQKFDFIKILLRSLNDEDKTRLIVKYGFNNNEFSPKTLFNYPENFGFEFGDDEYSEPKRQLLELVVKYCTNIKYFDLAGPDDNNINPTFNLIKNNMQNLNYIFIEFDLEFDDYNLSDDVIKISSIILQNLGQILPLRLEYLCLELSINMNDLKIFLNNSQNTFIKKLLIKNIVQDENDNHILSFIKDFIKKKNMVKYLAFSEFLDDNYNDLFSLKDEVNEFKLYNVEVQKYSDLYIRTYDFVNN
ncbi:hypothetical protein C1646_740245 [Rhizophagus diaphanus]|nr:hypothetical protein C1646_740245 [Rhizophagus diaphanus] [Rhizophagus sp. MUCL 43196]